MKKLMLLVLLAAQVISACAQESGYSAGNSVEDFKLKNVDGKMVSLSDYESAKGFIVVFTCNTCPYANAYEQRIIDLHNKYASKGFPVVAINPNDPVASPGDSFEQMQKRASEKKYPFPYLIDPEQTVTKRFGALRTPHVYVLTKESGTGKVTYVGAIDNDTEETNRERTK